MTIPYMLSTDPSEAKCRVRKSSIVDLSNCNTKQYQISSPRAILQYKPTHLYQGVYPYWWLQEYHDRSWASLIFDGRHVPMDPLHVQGWDTKPNRKLKVLTHCLTYVSHLDACWISLGARGHGGDDLDVICMTIFDQCNLVNNVGHRVNNEAWLVWIIIEVISILLIRHHDGIHLPPKRVAMLLVHNRSVQHSILEKGAISWRCVCKACTLLMPISSWPATAWLPMLRRVNRLGSIKRKCCTPDRSSIKAAQEPTLPAPTTTTKDSRTRFIPSSPRKAILRANCSWMSDSSWSLDFCCCWIVPTDVSLTCWKSSERSWFFKAVELCRRWQAW